jgi:tetratricopeptide (TPR) repeat protein
VEGLFVSAADREKIIQAAQKWVDKKRLDRAIEEYQKIVRDDPNDARTLLKIGDLQARMQDYELAIATYDRVGQFYAQQGFALKAIAVYKQIRDLIRKHAPGLTDRYSYIVPRLAEIYTQLGLTSDALAAFDEVAARYQRNGQDRDAIEVFRKMVELDSTNPLPYLRLAEACCRVQNLDEAIDAFWTAAELLLKLERRDDALKVIERILHFRPDPKYARVSAELYLQKGRREDGLQALAKLQIAFQADPRDIDTLALLAQAFTVIGQAEKSIEVYKEMARIARENGRHDLFEQLLTHLQDVAPNDDGVRALLSMAPGPPPTTVDTSAVSVNDADVEVVEEGFDEPPFELSQRQSHPEMRPPQMSSGDGVQVDSTVEVVEELGGDGTLDERFDADAHVHKAMVDAEAFRKLRLYSKAIETLHIALEMSPNAIPARERLRDILVESGDRDGAIGETIALATLYYDAGDSGQAEALLYEVLEAAPNHPTALEMLAEIGRGSAVPAEGHWSADGPTEMTEAASYYEGDQNTTHEQPAVPSGYGQYRRGPLPSYDLEEVSASSAMASPQILEAPPNSHPLEMDDPFQSGPNASSPSAPLPSFALQDDDLEDIEPDEYIQSSPSAAEGTFGVHEAPTHAGVAADAEATHEAVEEALEEAEFFTSRGLYDDAKAIVGDQLARSPNHPLLLERLREIEHLIAASVESVTIDRSQLGRKVLPKEQPVDRSFDIATSLEALDSLEQSAPPPNAAISGGGGDVDIDQVFQKFKEGVRAQVSENDSSTHYDLGVAYKEMGLLRDAITEFELAARDLSRECMCFAMIGMIRLERNELDQAAAAYIRALEAPQKTVDQEMALYYDLGNVYEMKGSVKDALYYFQKVARRDPGYRGVSDRIAALQPGRAPQSSSRSVDDEKEFDQIFDDLFESK